MRYREKFTLLKVQKKDGTSIYYCRFYDPHTGRRTKVSTGETTIGRARIWAELRLGDALFLTPRLGYFAADFFKWGICPRIKRQHAKGRSFFEYHAKARRGHLDKYVIPHFGKKNWRRSRYRWSRTGL